VRGTPGPGARTGPAWLRVAVALLLVVTAACGGGPAVTLSPGGGPDDPANQGGTLTIGVTQEPTSFLSAGIIDAMTSAFAVDAPVAEGLLWYRSTDDTATARSLADFWRPDLATEVPTVENGDVRTAGCRTVTYHGSDMVPAMCVTWRLRGGVLWHDGSRFSSHDVCATMQFLWLRYGTHNPTPIGGTSGYDRLIGCSEDGTLRATLSFRATYGAYLSMGSGVYGILPARLLDTAFRGNGDLERTPQTVDLRRGSGAPDAYRGTATLDRVIDGTGPFVLERYQPAHEIVLVRNRNYWDRARRPHLDRLIFRIVSDVTSQLDQARAGEIDMGLDYKLGLLPELEDLARSGRVRVETIPDAGAEKIDLNLCDGAGGLCGPQATPSPVTADVRVRRAMLEGIDRARIVQSIAHGQTLVPQDSWISLGAPFIRDPRVPTTSHDPEGARRRLEQAGYHLSAACHGGRGRADASGRCMDLDFVTTAGNPARDQAQVAIQSDLEALGIFTRLSTVKAGRLVGGFADGGLLSTHRFQLAMYMIIGGPESDTWYGAYHADCGGSCPGDSQIPSPANGGQGGDVTGISDPQLDRAFDEGRSTVALADRARAYMRAEERLAIDLPEIPIYQQVTVNSVTTRLLGVQRNDSAWTFNSAQWYCAGGRCQW
jgi:peptide/nickel transport system substrate-binding protein